MCPLLGRWNHSDMSLRHVISNKETGTPINKQPYKPPNPATQVIKLPRYVVSKFQLISSHIGVACTVYALANVEKYKRNMRVDFPCMHKVFIFEKREHSLSPRNTCDAHLGIKYIMGPNGRWQNTTNHARIQTKVLSFSWCPDHPKLSVQF